MEQLPEHCAICGAKRVGISDGVVYFACRGSQRQEGEKRRECGWPVHGTTGLTPTAVLREGEIKP